MKTILIKLLTWNFCALMICLLFNRSAYATYHQADHPIPLTDALKQINAHYNVNFLYEEKNISDKKVMFNAETLKGKHIDEVLTPLLSPLGLSWAKIDAKNYTIFPALKNKQKIGAEVKPQLIDTTLLDSVSNKNNPSLLQPVPETLKEINISIRRAVIETKSDRFIYNVENSAMASGNSIQLLKTAPFVKVSADNIVTLQGKRTMILIDNKPVPDASLESVLESLPAGNISKVELITQPSAKYDAAYGAVINIVTRKSHIDGLTGNIRADGSLGKYGMVNVNSSVTYRYKSLTIFGVGGMNRGSRLFEKSTNRELVTSGTPDVLQLDLKRLAHDKSYNFQAGADLELDKKQTIGILINGYGMNDHGLWGTNTAFRKRGGSIDSILNSNSTFNLKLSRFTYNFNYHLLADSGKNDLTFLTTLTPFRRNLFQYFPSILFGPSGETIRVPATYETTNISNINVYTAQLDYTHVFKDKWTIESGLKYQNTDTKSNVDYLIDKNDHFEHDPAYTSNSKLNEAISGIYGVLSKNWENNKIQAGIRIENTKVLYTGYYSQNYFNAFPALMYQHNFSADYNFILSYKRTIARAPYAELVPYSIFVNQYTIAQGNPALKPEYDNVYTLSTNIHKLNLSIAYTSSEGMATSVPIKQDYGTKVTYLSSQNLNHSSDVTLNLFYPLQLTSWWSTQNSGGILGYNHFDGKVLQAAYQLSGFHSDFRSSQTFTLSKVMKLQVDAYYWTDYKEGLTYYSGYKNIDAAILLEVMKGNGQLRLGGEQVIFKRNDYNQNQYFGAYTSREINNTDSKRINIGFTYKFGKSTVKSSGKKLGNEDAIKRL